MHDIAKDFISSRDKFAQFLGIELLEVGPGHAVARMPLAEHHNNGLGIVHGGAIFSLADLAFAAASNSRGQAAVAISCSISYVCAGSGAELTAVAEETSLTPKLATYKVTISDARGETVALFDGMVYRKRQTLAEAMG
ncbi:PaaI family thioesterase [Desulfocurvus sp. DL9XJH121]